VRDRFDGRPVEDLVEELARTRPDPLAEGLTTSDPEKRWNTVTKRMAAGKKRRPADGPRGPLHPNLWQARRVDSGTGSA
jgi:hypothetical protein